VEDIPEPEESARGQNVGVDSILPVLNKKLIANSLNILFDLLGRVNNKSLTTEVSSFLMLAVYRMLRVLHSGNPKNQEAMFGVPSHSCSRYSDAAMQVSEANAQAIAKGNSVPGLTPVKNREALSIHTEMLAGSYPAYASSLLNLIQNAESKTGFRQRVKK
jgi:hypothetical protein